MMSILTPIRQDLYADSALGDSTCPPEGSKHIKGLKSVLKKFYLMTLEPNPLRCVVISCKLAPIAILFTNMTHHFDWSRLHLILPLQQGQYIDPTWEQFKFKIQILYCNFNRIYTFQDWSPSGIICAKYKRHTLHNTDCLAQQISRYAN